MQWKGRRQQKEPEMSERKTNIDRQEKGKKKKGDPCKMSLIYPIITKENPLTENKM